MKGSLVALPLLLLFGVSGCGEKVEPVAPKNPPVALRGVTLATLSAEEIPELREAVGTVRARNSAEISARIAGSVSRLYVREGDRVARGRLLLIIEAAESGAAAAGALSGVEEAARALEEARARKRLADATYQRYESLFDEQAVTRQEFEVRRMEREVASEGVARAKARLSQARRSSEAAAAIAGYGRVTSPISGVLLAKRVEAGQTVFPGTPLVTVEGDQGFRLEVAAPEGLLGSVRAGDRVGVAVAGAPATGRVSEVVPTVDPSTRTFTVKIDLPGRGMRSGSYGKALFSTGAHRGISVPVSAVVERGALTSVWAVSRQGVARLRLVKLGRQLERRVEVLSGLSPGERIVVAGAERVADGARVE